MGLYYKYTCMLIIFSISSSLYVYLPPWPGFMRTFYLHVYIRTYLYTDKLSPIGSYVYLFRYSR